MGVCNEILEDTEMCMSDNGECESKDNDAFEIPDK